MTRIAFDIPAELEPYLQELAANLWNERGGNGALPSVAETVLWWLQKERDERDAREDYDRRAAIIDRVNPSAEIPF